MSARPKDVEQGNGEVIGRWKPSRGKTPRAPDGWRAYAIGDVHGRLDLLERLLTQIADDHASRGGDARPLLIFLGDLIDRGPLSAQVVERVRTEPLKGFRTITLCGNHEEVLLRLVDQHEPGLLSEWLRFGGDECLRSYGVDPDELELLPERQALHRLPEIIPEEHLRFLRDLGDTFRLGDYLFVHAGIRPGVALADQSPADLRWIRRLFLDDTRDHGFRVIHGHTISEQVEERPNRIGIDTGAYQFGLLTAIGVEAGAQWYLQARGFASHVSAHP